MMKKRLETNKFPNGNNQVHQDCLIKKLQSHLEKVKQSPTPVSLMLKKGKHMQQKSKVESLHGAVLALEAPNSAHEDFSRVQKLSRLKAAFKKQEETHKIPILVMSAEKFECGRRANDDDAVHKPKVTLTESILFDFGDGYGEGVNWVSFEKLFVDNFDPIKTDFVAACDKWCISTMQDFKYSRDDVFKLSSQEDTMKEFLREQIL